MRNITKKAALLAGALCMLVTTANGQSEWKTNLEGEPQGTEARKAKTGAEQMWLGYVDNDAAIYDNYGIGGFPEDLRVGGAIKLEADLLERYQGARIVGLAIGYASYTATTAELFIREDLGATNLAEGDGELTFGWNELNFTEPMEIGPDMKDLYFGYYMTMPALQYAIPVQKYAIVDNSCYLWTEEDMDGDKEVWYDDVDYYGMIILKVILECEGGLLDNMVELVSIRNHDLHIIGDQNEYIMVKVKNVGMNDVTSLGLSFNYNGEVLTQEGSLSGSIGVGRTEVVQMSFPAQGSGDVEVSLNRVNGEENKVDGSIPLHVWGITQEVADKYQRRPLLEFFESETSALIPQYKTEYFMPGFEPYADRISMLARHCDDQFQMGDNEDLRLLLDLVNNDSMHVYIPNFSVDRMDKLSDPIGHGYGPVLDIIFPDYVSPIYEEALATPTFASVNIASDLNEDQSWLTVTVSGEIEPGVMGDEPIFLSLYVTENNVDASSQQTKEGLNGFVHNNVIRLQPTDMYGKQLASNSGSYSETFRMELEPTWKLEDMKVVACLNRGGDNGYYDLEIINSNEFDVKDSGTGLCVDVREECRVYAGEGCVVAEGAERMEIFDVQGNRIERNAGLNGLYLVRVYTQQGSAVYKVFVR